MQPDVFAAHCVWKQIFWECKIHENALFMKPTSLAWWAPKAANIDIKWYQPPSQATTTSGHNYISEHGVPATLGLMRCCHPKLA